MWVWDLNATSVGNLLGDRLEKAGELANYRLVALADDLEAVDLGAGLAFFGEDFVVLEERDFALAEPAFIAMALRLDWLFEVSEDFSELEGDDVSEPVDLSLPLFWSLLLFLS